MLINILSTLAVIFLVLLTSILLVHRVGFQSRISALLSLYVFSVANIILVTQLASLLSQLNNRWVLLGLHLIVLAGVFTLWKKHSHTEKLKSFFLRSITPPEGMKDLLKRHPSYSLLATVILGLTLFNAFIALRVPPNTNDAMIQHLSRVGYWLQHGSMSAWNTPLVLQVAYPPNAQLQILWTILFTGVDRFAPLIQWFALPVSALAIYGLSTKLGWSRERSALTALLWMTLPQIVLQSTSTQNDLVSSALVVITLYFLYSGYKNHQKCEIFVSALTLALAMGTKQTVFLILPGLLIILVLFWLKADKKMRNLIIIWITTTFGFFLIFGAYIYIQNMVHFKTPFGPSEVISDTVRNEETSFWRNAALKMGRVAYQTFDLTEIPYRDYGAESKSMWIYNQAARLKATAGLHLFAWLNLDLESSEGVVNYPKNSFTFIPPLQIQEDITWFGPMFFILIPVTLISLGLAIKRKDKYAIGLLFIWLSLFLSINLFKSGWTPNQSRYYVLSVTCTMPLVSILWTTNKRKLINYLLLTFAILFMIFTMLMNFSKPLIGGRSIWNKSDAELRGLQSEGIRDSITKIDNAIPDHAVVGVALTGESFDYPLFDRKFSTKLIPALPLTQINDQIWLSENEICFVLIPNGALVEPELSVIQMIESSPGWTLYRVRNNDKCVQ